MKIRPGQIRPGSPEKVFTLTSTKGLVDWTEGGGGAGGGYRNTVEWTVVVPPNETRSDVLPLILAIRILRLEVNGPCRLRFYADVSSRDSDKDRVIDKRAEGNHGLIAEFIFSAGGMVLIASPAVDLANLESDPQPEIPYNITNLGETVDPIKIKMIYHEVEMALREEEPVAAP